MRLVQVRNGYKFVFENRGGVWQKIADDKARCIFGSKEDYGTEIPISSDTFVYGLFERPRYTPRESAQMVTGRGSGMKVVIGDVDDETVIMEIVDASAAQVAALSEVRVLRMKAPRKRIPREYAVLDTAVDISDNTLYVMVRPDVPVGKEEVEEEDETHNKVEQKVAPVAPIVEGHKEEVHPIEVVEPVPQVPVPQVPQADGGTTGQSVIV
jgi:hypothetical protein